MIILAKTAQRANRYITDMGLGMAASRGNFRVVTDSSPDSLQGVRNDTIVVLDRASLNINVQTQLSMLAQQGTPVVNVEPEQRGDLANSSDAEILAELVKRRTVSGLVKDPRRERHYEISIKVKTWGAPPEFTTAEEAQAWLDEQTAARGLG